MIALDRPRCAKPSRAVLRHESDERLVALARDGHESAFECIVERYRLPLHRYAGRVLGPHAAEDVVQQTFIAALRFLREDPRPLVLKPWLYRVAHNAALNAAQRRGGEYEQLSEDFDGVPQPPDQVERREQLRDLVAHVRALPERQRSAIVLRELEGRSHREIADRLGADEPVVRQLIYRARTRLRDAVGALIPLPLLRAWLSGGGGATQQTTQLVGGAGATGLLVKGGAIVLAAGAVAVGGHAAVSSSARHGAHKASPKRAVPVKARTRDGPSGAAERSPAHAAKARGARPSSHGHALGAPSQAQNRGAQPTPAANESDETAASAQDEGADSTPSDPPADSSSDTTSAPTDATPAPDPPKLDKAVTESTAVSDALTPDNAATAPDAPPAPDAVPTG